MNRKGMLCVFVAAGIAGCSSAPEATQTGFLNDYSQLKETGPQRMAYTSARLGQYHSFIVDPIEMRVPPGKLSAAEQTEIAVYFRNKVGDELRQRGFSVVNDPGAGVGRVQMALTDVTNSTWWMKLHPGMRMSGAGTGGASMEAEVVDSVTGEQVGAVVQASPGRQFDLTAFSTVADVKSAIDQWAEHAGRRLEELRAQAK